MPTCQRCGDESGWLPDGGPAELCEDCFEIQKATRTRSTGKVRNQRVEGAVPALMSKSMSDPARDVVPAGGSAAELRRAVARVHNEVATSGDPMGADAARLVVELALLRCLPAQSLALSQNAASKLMSIYGLGKSKRAVPAPEPEEADRPVEDEDACDDAARDLAERLGIQVI